MKGVLLALGIMSAAGTAVAEAPSRVQDWLHQAREQITQAAQAPAGRSVPVVVSFRVNADRPFTGAQVVSSSGSREVDDAVLSAVRRTRPQDPPAELVGRKVTLTVAPPATPLQAATTTRAAR